MDAKELKKIEKKITPEMEDKYWKRFEHQAHFVGNGVYSIANLYSTDTRELFVMFVASQEGIKLPDDGMNFKDEE